MPAELRDGVPDAIATPTRPVGKLGKYELVRRIAVGGMAELYLAKERSLHGFERTVVLKCILPQYADSPEFIDMLINEARLAALLVHPNIAQVYDIGSDEGRYFVVMEFVDGHDLRAVVRASNADTPLHLAHVLTIIVNIASGLHHAHEATDLSGRPLGLVHRDVSPSNVLLTAAGGIKLVDFGIAKAYALQPRTLAGALKGKVPYMSPEQCRSELLDRRSDVFSLGTLLWELSLGTRLFRNSSNLDTMQSIASGRVPRPRSLQPSYPAELERIVMKALAPSVSQRYQTAQQLQLELEEFARQSQLALSTTRLGQHVRLVFSRPFSGQSDVDAHSLLPESGAGPADAPTVAESSLAIDTGSLAAKRRRTWPLWAAAMLSVVGLATPLMLLERTPSATAVQGDVATDSNVAPPSSPIQKTAASIATPSRTTMVVTPTDVGSAIGKSADGSNPDRGHPSRGSSLPTRSPNDAAPTTTPITAPRSPTANADPKSTIKTATKPTKTRKARKRRAGKRSRKSANRSPKKGSSAWNPDSALPPPG